MTPAETSDSTASSMCDGRIYVRIYAIEQTWQRCVAGVELGRLRSGCSVRCQRSTVGAWKSKQRGWTGPGGWNERKGILPWEMPLRFLTGAVPTNW